MSELSPADRRWLEAAARIAMPYRGTTAENPTVGALVVSPAGVMLGRGVTSTGGRPHAEPQALAMAGAAARGATLYLTLEPCNHWGRTPPCVDAVVASGVARVVCGAIDPDPRTAGQSLAKLRTAGVEVALAGEVDGVRRLHEGFFRRIVGGRPFVTAKLAISKDGMIGRADEGRVAITGEAARRWTHVQRAMSDAVMVGATTARLDDPRLDVRLPGLEARQPLRVVLAGRRHLPEGLILFSQSFGQPAVIIAQRDIAESLSHLGEIESIDTDGSHQDLAGALTALGRRGIGRLLVEGGAALNDSLLDAGLVDRFHLLESQVSVGTTGVSATVHRSLPERLLELGFAVVETRGLGCDMLTTYEKA